MESTQVSGGRVDNLVREKAKVLMPDITREQQVRNESQDTVNIARTTHFETIVCGPALCLRGIYSLLSTSMV